MVPDGTDQQIAGAATPRRLCVYVGGFLWKPRLRRILNLAGYDVRLAVPREGDAVGVWGLSPNAWRGERMAERYGADVIRIEDAFLRSLHPGRAGEPPVGLLIDKTGVHFDGRAPSDLETLLRTHLLDDSAVMARARSAISWMRRAHLTKYSAVDPTLPPPDPGYVLVIDQTRGDASVIASGGSRERFLELLAMASGDHPGAPILIRTHPETRDGHRAGHFTADDQSDRIRLHDAPVSTWDLLEGAIAVYTLSSQLGFEAILAGHKPHVLGAPFYAGWGLTQDYADLPRRGRALSRAQLFAGAMMLYPTWYDPCRDRLCEIEDVLAQMDAQARAWREDRHGWVASGMRLWKRGHLQRFYGQHRRMRFTDDPARSSALAARTGRRQMCWAGKAAPDSDVVRVEDGFLRSRGLGAELVPPLSLVTDDLGIYYDPSRPSRLEVLIERAASRAPEDLVRADQLRAALVAAGLSKYNLGGALPDLPEGHRILVPGQVEDDASILAGCGALRTNAALLERTRAENPKAVILYKPHPDVQAGLRAGGVEAPERWADAVITEVDMGTLLPAVQEVWTLTSLTGFEALLRGCAVTTLGVPFYAGWGLTRDLGDVPARRTARVSLAALVQAVLIDYPRYRDPVTGLPCAAEVIVDRLTQGDIPAPGPFNRSLSKLQGLFASQAWLWR